MTLQTFPVAFYADSARLKDIICWSKKLENYEVSRVVKQHAV